MSVKRPKHLLNIGCTNPYLVNGTYYPCGHCKACMIAKMNRNKYALEWELSDSRTYKAFILLTYRDEDLPLRKLSQKTFDSHFQLPIYNNPKLTPKQNADKNNKRQQYYTFELNKVVKISNKRQYVKAYSRQSDASPSELSSSGYNNRTHPDGYYMLPTLQYSDVSTFIKRLRTKVFRSCGENFRFVSCGEYGPTGFRPHYHLIIICPSHQCRQSVMQHYRSCWTYGFSNAQYYVANKNSANYVAGYLTSSSVLPKLYRYRPYRPFFRASNFLGKERYASYTQLLSTLASRSFSHILPKKTTECTEYTAVLSSVEHSLLPRCRGFRLLSTYQREQRYTFFLQSGIHFKKIVDEIFLYAHNYGNTLQYDILKSKYSMLARYVSVYGYHFGQSSDYDTLRNSVYRDYRTCQLFALSCHQIFGHYCPQQMVRLIEDYYSHKDSVNLSRQLQTLQENNIFPQDFSRYYYNQDITTDAYKRFYDVSPIQEDLLEEYEKYCDLVIFDRIKTKKINDIKHRLCPTS